MTDLYRAAMNRLCKWRVIFTGWQLGPRPKGDPEADAVRDHRELSLLLRVESNALAALLVKKGVFTQDEFARQVAEECELYQLQLEARFPGMRAADYGMMLTNPEAAETMKGWRP